MDLYRFLSAFDKGCERMKYDDEEKMSNFLFQLNDESQKIYLEIRVQQRLIE